MKEMMNDPVWAAIATGAVMSPGCLLKAGVTEQFSTKCIACGEVGFHDHIYWQCPMVEMKVGMVRPKTEDLFQRRYGWPRDLKTSGKEDVEVLLWMRVVTLEILNQRYSTDEREKIEMTGM